MAADGRTPPSRDIDVRLFVPLMAHSVAVHAIVSLARVTITYRAIELDLSVVWIGVIAAGFSLMPVFVAVQVGRYIDRGHDSVAAWIGAVLVLAACVGLWLWPLSAGYLLALSILLGVGPLFCMAAHPMLAVRCAGPRSREAVFGHFMIAIAIGQGLGPTALGLLGGSSALPPTGMLFAVCVAGAVASLVIAFALRPARAAKPRREEGQVVPVAALLRLQGLVV